jgi:enamine deaminase RidA (YjgF/YER057c/UK114 family)
MNQRNYTTRCRNWRLPEPIRELVTSCDGARYGELILVGGQYPLNERGEVLALGDAAAQAGIAMKYVNDVITDLGGAGAHLVKLTVFYIFGGDELELSILRRIRSCITGTPPPAISMVPLPRLALPGIQVTIDAVAICTDDGATAQAADSNALARHWQWPKDAEFSHGVRCGKWAFVSGQMSLDVNGETQYAGRIVDQAKLTIKNMSNVLEATGCDLDDVVKLNTWYTGDGTDADWRKAAEVRVNAFRFPGPGATGVPVPGPYPRNFLIRQECMAIRDPSGARLPRSLSWPLGHWDWPIPVSFQQGLKIGSLVVLGGQISTDVNCKATHPGNMRAQTQNVMESIQNILAGFDLKMDALAKLSCYYKTVGSQQDLTDMIEVCARYIPDPTPPITFIPLENLGFEDVTLEIEGLAVANG